VDDVTFSLNGAIGPKSKTTRMFHLVRRVAPVLFQMFAFVTFVIRDPAKRTLGVICRVTERKLAVFNC